MNVNCLADLNEKEIARLPHLEMGLQATVGVAYFASIIFGAGLHTTKYRISFCYI